MSTPPSLGSRHIELPLAADIISVAADWLYTTQSADRESFDYSQRLVLAPSQAIARSLASALASRTQQAGLLPPQVQTPMQWAQTVRPFASNTLAQQLALQHWLDQSQHAFQTYKMFAVEQHPSIAAELDSLLTALALTPLGSASYTLDEFHTIIEAAYAGTLNPILGNLSTGGLLQRETELVFAAWQTFSAEYRRYPDSLQAGVQQLNDPKHDCLLVGFDYLTPVETSIFEPCSQIRFSDRALNNDSCHVVGDASTHAINQQPSNREHLVTALSDTNTSLHQRAKKLQPSDCHNLRLLQADDAEHETWMVCSQIKLWLTEGKSQISIVVEDREFGRRLRALLERANIAMADRGGWSLATTRVATAVERWLQCVEENSPATALLDVLHSGLLDATTCLQLAGEGINRNEAQQRFELAIHRLEADLVHHEGVVQGLDDYQHALQKRSARLAELWPQHGVSDLQQLLTTLQLAISGLSSLMLGKTSTPQAFSAALQKSLSQLGMLTTLAHDPAGSGVVECLLQLEQLPITDQAADQLSWQNLRSLLRQQLESQEYRPAHGAARVVLCNLNQAYLEKPDAVILAAANQSTLPGNPTTSHLFNHRVRQQLGIMNRTIFHVLQQHRFLRLLNNSPECLITWSATQDDSPALPAVWIEQLLALGQANSIELAQQLTHSPLANWARLAMLQADSPNMQKEHVQPTQRPAPAASQNMLSAQLSASAHQDLIDCPYKFFYARMLGLRAPEAVRAVLAKNDFGALVHRCLHAFTTGVDGLPGPFTDPLDQHQYAKAHALLVEIGVAVFARDTAENIWHLGWQQAYEKLLPPYLRWEIDQQSNWQWHAAETTCSAHLTPNCELSGRLDRIDTSRGDSYLDQSQPMRVVDYKTGNLPSKPDVIAGEAVQLPTYALLEPQAQQVAYLQLTADKIREMVIEDDELENLTQQVGERLHASLTDIESGAPLPAHGDPTSCSYCDFSGLCRQQIWRQANDVVSNT